MLMEALDRAEKGMDFADALHLGAAAVCDAMLTFDRHFIVGGCGPVAPSRRALMTLSSAFLLVFRELLRFQLHYDPIALK